MIRARTVPSALTLMLKHRGAFISLLSDTRQMFTPLTDWWVTRFVIVNGCVYTIRYYYWVCCFTEEVVVCIPILVFFFFVKFIGDLRFQGFSAAKSSVMSELQTIFTAQYIGIIKVSVEIFVLLRCTIDW